MTPLAQSKQWIFSDQDTPRARINKHVRHVPILGSAFGLLLAVSFGCSLRPGEGPGQPVSPLEGCFRRTLSNGLQVVVRADHRFRAATVMLVYRVGSADDPEGYTGMAHFLEHMVFRGTDRYGSGEIDR